LRGDLWLHAEGWEAALAKVREALASALDRAPHRSLVERLALREGTKLPVEVLDGALEDLAARGEIALEGGTKVRSRAHVPRLSPDARAALPSVAERLESAPYAPPTASELAEQLALPPSAVAQALEHLCDEGRAVAISADLYVSSRALASLKEAVASNIAAKGELDIPALRDALGTTRKYLIPFLEHLDEIGFTTRLGARRILKKTG
jgi:selenocysteine-specific elongation factor